MEIIKLKNLRKARILKSYIKAILELTDQLVSSLKKCLTLKGKSKQSHPKLQSPKI